MYKVVKQGEVIRILDKKIEKARKRARETNESWDYGFVAGLVEAKEEVRRMP